MLTMSCAQASELDIGYDSRYVSEGRNQLSAGGIYWINGSHEVNENISLGIAYGLASDSQVNYDELNLIIGYSNSVEGFDYFIGYTRLEFLEDNESDDEISFAIEHTETDLLTPFANLVYSVEVDGYFIDIGAKKDFELSDKLSITPHMLMAFDFGYASAEKGGSNHAAIGASLAYSLSKHFVINGILEQTFGRNTIKKEVDKANQFWSGIHFTYSW
jgi:hypothetical protein